MAAGARRDRGSKIDADRSETAAVDDHDYWAHRDEHDRLHRLYKPVRRRATRRQRDGAHVRHRRLRSDALCGIAGGAQKSSGLAAGTRANLDARPSLAGIAESVAYPVSLRLR